MFFTLWPLWFKLIMNVVNDFFILSVSFFNTFAGTSIIEIQHKVDIINFL